jgi:hypothetical protein
VVSVDIKYNLLMLHVHLVHLYLSVVMIKMLVQQHYSLSYQFLPHICKEHLGGSVGNVFDFSLATVQGKSTNAATGLRAV